MCCYAAVVAPVAVVGEIMTVRDVVCQADTSNFSNCCGETEGSPVSNGLPRAYLQSHLKETTVYIRDKDQR